jgi:xanthosine phosphorylase
MTHPSEPANVIKARAPHFQPKIGLILGSGLGSLADQINDAVSIPYSELPGFPVSTVAGHAGRLVLGTLGGMPVACCQGRVHGYEGTSAEKFKIFIRTLKLIGCETLLITNASGSLRPEVGPGELMLLNDHINLNPGNPLVGPNEEEFGPKFFPMDDAYDPNLRQCFHQAASQLNIKLTDGVYVGVMGPCFETPAEIRAFRTLGGDCVGMSTVSEVIVARHCGLRVAAVAAITNFAAGMSDEKITHEGTLHYGKIAAENLTKLIIRVIENLQHEPR